MKTREGWLSSGQRLLIDVPAQGGGPRRWPIFCRASPSPRPWVTLLHGSPTSSWDFARLVPLIEAQRSPLAFDFLGFGGSDKPPIRYDIQDQASLTEAVWARHRVHETWIIAHDYGLLVALELLARQARCQLSARIRGLTLLNGPAYPDSRDLPLGARLLRVPLLGAYAALARGLFLSELRRLYGPSGRPDDSELAQHWEAIEQRGGRSVLRSLLHTQRDLALHHERWAWALEAELVPVHFIWGLADPLDGQLASALQSRKPGASFLSLPSVGHFPHVEDPVQVADATLEAISRAQRE